MTLCKGVQVGLRLTTPSAREWRGLTFATATIKGSLTNQIVY
jgi:hypothetical protein